MELYARAYKNSKSKIEKESQNSKCQSQSYYDNQIGFMNTNKRKSSGLGFMAPFLRNDNIY